MDSLGDTEDDDEGEFDDNEGQLDHKAGEDHRLA
jgi:hypothetical protein